MVWVIGPWTNPRDTGRGVYAEVEQNEWSLREVLTLEAGGIDDVEPK